MRSSKGFFGLAGVTLLLFAFVLGVFTSGAGNFDVLAILLHLIGGVACLIVYLSSGVENLRDFLSKRSTKYGTSTVLASVFFIGILAAVNFLSTRYNTRWDLTESGAYSLSAQTTSVLANLANELTMEAFVERGINPQLEDLLRRYADSSTKATYRIIDPDTEPELAERYAIRSFNTVRLAYGDQSTTVDAPTEENLTNALIKLTRDVETTVCNITGHGEPSFDDRETVNGFALAKEAIENENYKLESVLLPSMQEIPDTCSAVVIAGPARAFLEHEIDALGKFIRRGGGVFALVAPRQSPELVDFFQYWGIDIGNDVVVDQVVRLFQGPSLGLAPLVQDYAAEHEITRELRERSLFPMVRSVSKIADPRDGMTVTELATTSPSSWAETDLDALFGSAAAAIDPGERRGPISIAAASQIDLSQLNKPGEGEARIVVVGSVEFADNQNLEGTFFNRDLFLNSVGWLAGQGDLLSIRARGVRASRASFTSDEGTLIFYLSVLVIPEFLLLLGLYVWWRRN